MQLIASLGRNALLNESCATGSGCSAVKMSYAQSLAEREKARKMERVNPFDVLGEVVSLFHLVPKEPVSLLMQLSNSSVLTSCAGQ